MLTVPIRRIKHQTNFRANKQTRVFEKINKKGLEQINTLGLELMRTTQIFLIHFISLFSVNSNIDPDTKKNVGTVVCVWITILL